MPRGQGVCTPTRPSDCGEQEIFPGHAQRILADRRPSARQNAGDWTVAASEVLGNGRLTVVVGVIRDPLDDVRRHLDAESGILHLHLHLPRAVVSARDVQACVRAIKDAVSAAAARLRPDGIDLFFLGPGVLAAALGHRWNVLPPTVFFEHDRAGGYTPTVVVR